MSHDIVALAENDPHEGQPLLEPMMLAGQRIHSKISLHDLRQQTLANYTHLSKVMTTLEATPAYPVTISTALQDLAKQLDAEMVTHL